jgi:hypothetical protein
VDDSVGDLIAHVQVKTATTEVDGEGQDKGQYLVRKNQLQAPRRVRLYFVFALLTASNEWDLVVLSREELGTIRERYEEKKSKESSETKSKHYNLRLIYTKDDVRVWDESLQAYRGRKVFEKHFPLITSGPGSKDLGSLPEE